MKRGTAGGVGWALIAAIAFGVCLVAAAPRVRAFEIELPGERKVDIHGWYELRLRFIGDDLPANGVTFSQFRHVLNVETDISLLPDGLGAIDMLLAYGRFQVAYDSIYDHGGWLFPNADAYGGEGGRDPESLPRNVKMGVNGPQFVGGTSLRRRTDTGQLTRPFERLNPGGRPRGPVNPSGVSENPNPVAALANLNARSTLDSPTDAFASPPVHARGAAFAGPVYYPNYVLEARSQLGEQNFLDLVGRLASVPGAGARGELRVLDTRIASALASGRKVDDSEVASWIAQRDRILIPDPTDPNSVRLEYFTFDRNLMKRFAFPEVPNGPERNLMAVRPDPSVFSAIARRTTPELETATFGAHVVSSTSSTTYLATLGTPIRPLGYFGGPRSADLINNLASGVATGIRKIDVSTFPSGSADVFAAATTLGPDGIPNSADDLPETGAGLPPELELEAEIPPELTNFRTVEDGVPAYQAVAFARGTLDERTGHPFVLFGVANPVAVLRAGCRAAGGTLQGDTCLDSAARQIDPGRIREIGCIEVGPGGRVSAGINAEGDCLTLNNSDGSTGAGVHFGEALLLSDPRFRPPKAFEEAFDLTDLRMKVGTNQVLPARPHAPGSAIAFRSPGTTRLLRNTHHIVSNLELDFEVDELQWSHGASDDEQELREGYLEFEALDSQVFARAGKQILVWGKTEIFRGADRFNPSDLGGGLVGSTEDTRIAQWGVDLVFSPRWAMNVGPFRDMRLEGAMVFDDFEPTDLGMCGEAGTVVAICAKTIGAMAHGLSGLGLVGEIHPDDERSGLERYDFGARFEGHWRRFAFSISDFWGWDDSPVQDVVFQYRRRVDPATGAPVNAFGPLSCKVRMRDGRAVGPDGDPDSDYDNAIPSDGNCLLFDPPKTEDAAQGLRAAAAIAAHHSVNQTLFHTACSFTFDPDSGYCSFDQPNDPGSFPGLAALISGVTETGIVFEGVETLRLSSQSPSASTFLRPGAAIASSTAPVVREVSPGVTFQTSLSLPPEQQALLGCGPSFVAPCGRGDLTTGFAASPDFKRLVGMLEIAPNFFEAEPPGGVDLMNADGAVLTQESTLLKALQPGQLIGTRLDASGSRFESGVTVAGINSVGAEQILGVTPRELRALDPEQRAALIRAAKGLAPSDPLPASDAWIEPFPWQLDPQALRNGLVVFQVADQTQLDPRCDPNRAERRRDATGEPVFSEVETAYCSRRAIGWASDPNTTVFNDPTDPTNPANDFLVPFDGDESDLYDADGNRSAKLLDWVRRLEDVSEQCTALFKLNSANPEPSVAGSFFDRGCTALEGVSANFERFTTALAIIGGDRTFDPPETLTEVLNMLDSGFATDSFGDPISGPDGIVAKNQRVFAVDDPEGRRPSPTNDVQALIFANAGKLRTFDQILPTLDLDGDGGPDGRTDLRLSDLTMNEFFGALNPEAICDAAAGRCHAQVGAARNIAGTQGTLPQIVPEGAGLPVAISSTLATLDDAPVPAALAKPMINMLELFEKRPLEFAHFWAGERVRISNLDPNGVPIALDDPRRIRLKYNRPGVPSIVDFDSMDVRAVDTVLDGLKSSTLNIDANPRGIQPFDQDRDGVYDGLDDGSPGPVSDDAILCGSGLPGDLLQSIPQVELYSEGEESAFHAKFPKGLPRRSPVNCTLASIVAGGTGQTLPFVRAGGDGRYGRRDFYWQGGREIVLEYDKRNVLSFGLDFADDPTRTSWNLELTWEEGMRIPDTNSPDGLSDTDQYVLAVSVDRPTFFRFLNPSRTFFLNLQFFVRYLTEYNGGSDDRDGNYGFAEGPWSGQTSLTLFTGYFQDRLTPRATFTWDPTSSGYAIFWGLGYRFRNNFVADLRVSHFFGDLQSVRRAMYPTALYGDPRLYVSSGRGLGNAYNEDSAGIALRYSW